MNEGLDEKKNDNKILSVALYYTMKNSNFLTADINLKNIVTSQGLRVMDSSEYLVKRMRVRRKKLRNEKK